MRIRHLVVLTAFGLVVPLAALAQEARDLSAASARVSRRPDGGPLTGPSAASRAAVVAGFLRARHDERTVQSLVLQKENPTRSGVIHVAFGQEVAGLAVYGTYVRAAVRPGGELVSVVENLAAVPPALVETPLPARAALTSVLAEYYAGRAPDLREVRETGNTVVFERGGLFAEEPTATRVAVAMANGALHVGYLVVTWDRDNILRHAVVGAGGRILIEELRTNSDKYLIFPDHPGNSSQTLVNGPGSGNAESPDGWVTSDRTTGNNVDAYLDRDNNNQADADGRPVSATQDFQYTVDLTQDPTTTTNQMAAVTNLFYLNNVIHDKLYRHGFTEAAGNFQENNFGKGGSGSDSVNAEAQDGGGTNNANFATPNDGSNPRMQMYLWTQTSPRRDGDLDSDIVWHEYGHGLTWRMIGSMSGPLAGAIGEGMSDTLAIYINRNDTVGEYAFNSATGIRRFRYTNYPLTYADVTGQSVHNDGEIYAATMWKLLELWEAADHTQDELFDYVVGGMNFTPSRPAYEDMRDGILAAVPTAAKDCIVWQAFAHFGIGEGASGTESSCNPFRCRVTITPSFIVPESCSGGGGENTAPTVNITAPSNGASFVVGSSISFGGTADDSEDGNIAALLSWISSLDGSIGNGSAFSTTDLSVGSHTITASVSDSGGLSGSDSIQISVTDPPSGGILLSANGFKVKGVQHADLTWTGASGSLVDIFRDGVLITTTANDGAHTDNVGRKGGGTASYRVCDAGSSTCSNTVVVSF